MTFEKVKEYLEKTEAVANYEQSKEKNRQIKEDYANIIHELTDVKEELQSYKDLRIKYDKVEYNLKDFDIRVAEETWKKERNNIKEAVEKRWNQEKSKLINQRLQEILDNYPKGAPKKLSKILSKSKPKPPMSDINPRNQIPGNLR